jgi:NhaA family Na+:H+ antiporter
VSAAGRTALEVPVPEPSAPETSTPRPRRGRGTASVLLDRLPLPERTFVADALRTETVGGIILLAAAVASLIWANTLHHSYLAASDFHFGPGTLGLHLSVAHWAADGLLAVFFFVAGVEVKRELVAGELRTPAAAALPVIAALCGMAVPAILYAVVSGADGGSLKGWAVPTATDIAFALAVLAVVGTALPAALRAFLLTLAVVDDLCAILIIAVFFTSDINLAALAGAAAGLVLMWWLLRAEVRGWYVYLPLALVIWGLMYNSGVHATIAGVAMGLLPRCATREGERRSPGERVEHLVRPLSAGLAVPLFALFAAGVTISGGALADVFSEPETLGVVIGLVAGKTIGVFCGTWLAARFTRAQLNPDLGWADVLAVAALAGIGFTVSLLIGELAFSADPLLADRAKAAVLVGSVIAAVLAGILLRLRNNTYRRAAGRPDWRGETADPATSEA